MRHEKLSLQMTHGSFYTLMQKLIDDNTRHSLPREFDRPKGDDEPDEYAGSRADREASAADRRNQLSRENDNG